MANSNQIIEEIEGILEEYNILKKGFEPLGYLGLLGKDSEEIAETDRLITKIRTLISENCGTESEYYKSLERESRKRGRDYLSQCISILKAYYEKLKSNIESEASQEIRTEPIIKAEINKRAVFVVHGRNEEIRSAMFEFLRAIGLEPIEWEKAIQMTGKPNPHIDEILIEAFNNAQAILIIFTPDDLAKLNPRFLKDNDPSFERDLTGQARLNVLFEAGMAYGKDPNRAVLVEIGKVRPFSDISGRHLVKFKGTSEDRNILANRLKLVGCGVNLEGNDWLSVGDFSLIDVDTSLPEEVQTEEPINEPKKLLVQDLFDKLKKLFIRLYESKAGSSPIFAWTIHDSIEMQDYFGITARGTPSSGKDLDDFEIYFMDKLFKIIPNSATLSWDFERKGNYGFLIDKNTPSENQEYYLKKFFNYLIRFVKKVFSIKIEFDENIQL